MSNPESDRGEFPTESLEKLRQRVRHARAMIRSVMVATLAIEDGSVNFGGMGGAAHRWGPVTSAALDELSVVRDTAINTPIDLPEASLGWVKPLAQIEALDAALWYGGCTRRGDGLENFEILDAAEAIVVSLDELLKQARPSAIPQVGQAAAVPA